MYLQPESLSIVLVGEASAFLSDLQAAGFKDVEVMSIEDLDLESVDF